MDESVQRKTVDKSKTIASSLIREYEESAAIIRKAMEDGQLVLFVGAGVSKSATLPLWNEAVREIAKRLHVLADENQKEQIDSGDYLKIPQYYYNSRGGKEYTQLIRKIFRADQHYDSNALHDAIIGLNTNLIITTNYDHLLEQAAEKSAQSLGVISKDTDFPYCRSPKRLIKMHGDFENGNFVLKEDDYLNYSRNFSLIENYIKSIIGTKGILFLGYSFNDPDLKQIFTWAKEVLKGIFRPLICLMLRKPMMGIEQGICQTLVYESCMPPFGCRMISSKRSRRKIFWHLCN